MRSRAKQNTKYTRYLYRPSYDALLGGTRVVDLIYLLMLAALYAVTHALVWALERLGKSA